jgi:hypothetical protein
MALSTSVGDTVLVVPEVLEPAVAADVPVVVAFAVVPAAVVLLVEVLEVTVVVAVVPAGTVVLLPDELVVVLDAPSVWPKAWNTASMKVLKLLAGFAAPCDPRLASSSPSLSPDDACFTPLVAVLALVPLTPAGAALPFNPDCWYQLMPPLPYPLTFIFIPFTRCAIDRAGRDINGCVARDRMWPRVRPTVGLTALPGGL